MAPTMDKMEDDLMQLTLQIRNRKDADKKYGKFHGDTLIGDQIIPPVGLGGDLKDIFTQRNWPALKSIVDGLLLGKGLDGPSAAQLAGSLSDYSTIRQKIIDSQVKAKYDKMLHPPLTYLGNAFQYRTADGKFNSVINPHLGQAGAPYAKTVPSQTAPLGALPDPSDLFDKLMARQEGGRQSTSGLSSMLIYHATIIIHDIFRTNESDKNISDSSSYLDLSPLYGYTMEMQRKVRDGTYGLGHLKPDTFAEDRLLRQPPGVCIMLVMYNRYHNYAAKQLHRINENGRFSVPEKYADSHLVSVVKNFYHPGPDLPIGLKKKTFTPDFLKKCSDYEQALKKYKAGLPASQRDSPAEFHGPQGTALKSLLKEWGVSEDDQQRFGAGYKAAWTKLDDDLFNTARLITCGMYIQISVHDYLRALMGFHQFDTNFTLDPRSDFDQKKTTRGIGNQVTVEFNLLYRFHCAISLKDEEYAKDLMRATFGIDPDNCSLQTFLKAMRDSKQYNTDPTEPSEVTFGIPNDSSRQFVRNEITNLFDDDKMIHALTAAMDDPISNFGPRNIPRCLKAVEIMGILQARKWEIGTLNDFREFFEMDRHTSFESISKNVEIQNALRDLYEHPDKVELYPGIFCESDEYMGLDPGPIQASSALWSAIFSDAITLVRSDRFYTVDWNTNSLTSWGMNEVTPDNSNLKSSVFHRLIQRAFPGWFPYNSIRFFHPFYTAQQNAIYAAAQGYAPEFKMSDKPTVRNPETDKLEFDVSKSNPEKPKKPVYKYDFENIALVLNDKGHDFMHPALVHPENLPKQMRNILDPAQKRSAFNALHGHLLESEPDLKKYLDDLMRCIIKRESIAMTNSTFQIDATRDFAIPVVTRYVADFLGFGHRMRTESDLSGQYSENQIYQHITNCQIFLSYNADETKLLKRRKAFKASMAFLIDLTRRGNIAEANQWGVTRALFGKKSENAMSDLGLYIAQRVLEYESDAGKAAAVLLLVCLDFAYNSVVSFTAVLDEFMRELYEAANKPASAAQQKPTWLTVQKLAFSDAKRDHDYLESLIQKTARLAVKLPILRTAVRDHAFKPQSGSYWNVKEGQTVILDIHAATVEAEKENKTKELEFLTFQLSFAEKFAAYHPRHFAVLALTAMVKFIAQMKNPRRGHDAQGKLKRINLGWTAEGYSNFMAPARMDWIAEQVEQLPPDDPNKSVFTDKVLKPETDTYLTPNWDEMVPFPMTWKIRFDGFGPSDYSTEDDGPYGRVKSAWLPDDVPPWYQPQGASHVGGTFADVGCVCVQAGTHCSCLKLSEEAQDGAPAKSLVPNAAAHMTPLTSGCSLSK